MAHFWRCDGSFADMLWLTCKRRVLNGCGPGRISATSGYTNSEVGVVLGGPGSALPKRIKQTYLKTDLKVDFSFLCTMYNSY